MATATAAPDPGFEIRGALAEARDLLREAREVTLFDPQHGHEDLRERIDTWLREQGVRGA
jgi:hypothetical protein